MSYSSDEFNAYWDGVRERAYGTPSAPAKPKHPSGLTADVPFKDQQAMADAMKDPRYANDPEYRKQVAARALGGVQARARYGR